MNEFDTNAQDRLVDHDATESERQYAMWMHLSLLGNLFAPFVIFIVPLVMWLAKKDESPFIDDHGRETMNFHISLFIYMIGSTLLALITCGVAVVLIPGIYILGIIGMIAASKAANRGEYYRYPMSMRFL